MSTVSNEEEDETCPLTGLLISNPPSSSGLRKAKTYFRLKSETLNAAFWGDTGVLEIDNAQLLCASSCRGRGGCVCA